MMAVSCAALTSSASRGEATVTSPAPMRSAPRAREPRGSGAMDRPRHDDGVPARIFVALRLRPGKLREPERAARWRRSWARWRQEHASGMPISATLTSPQWSPSRQEKVARLQAEEGHGRGGAMAVPLTSPVVPSMPLGTSMATTGEFGRVDALDQARRACPRRDGRALRRTGRRPRHRRLRAGQGRAALVLPTSARPLRRRRRAGAPRRRRSRACTL